MRKELRGSSAACLAWSIPASLVLFLCAGATHTRWLVVTISSTALHTEEAQEPGSVFVCRSPRATRQRCLFFFSFSFPCQGQVSSVVLIKGTVACHASRFCTEYDSFNGCCQSVNLYTKRQPGTRKISPDLQNGDKITKIQDWKNLS